MMAGLLPAAGILGSYLATTLSASDTAAGRWVLEALQVRSLPSLHLSTLSVPADPMCTT